MLLTRRRSTGLAPATRSPAAPSLNYLLAALPPDENARIAETLAQIPLRCKTVLHQPNERIQYVYFPAGGFCSIVAVLNDGAMVQVATVGREGMIGACAVLDIPTTYLSMVNGEMDICFRMTADAFRREMDRREAFYQLVIRFESALIGCIMQSTACVALHSVEQRLACWLLMAQDRLGHSHFPLTQQLVAMMLGVARPTVSVVAGTLQKARIITYRRGRVTVVNRQRLESVSCECYRAETDLLRAVTQPFRQLKDDEGAYSASIERMAHAIEPH
jgi:CRP-like cAMP-binding protein